MAIKIYKSGQGKYTRLGTAFSGVTIVAIGCWCLYKLLEARDFGLWIETMVPAGLFVALVVLIFWLVNTPSVADFLIAAEGEIKKVSWSSRKEVAVSTFIVIMVVVIMAGLLGVTDWLFSALFYWLLLQPG